MYGFRIRRCGVRAVFGRKTFRIEKEKIRSHMRILQEFLTQDRLNSYFLFYRSCTNKPFICKNVHKFVLTTAPFCVKINTKRSGFFKKTIKQGDST